MPQVQDKGLKIFNYLLMNIAQNYKSEIKAIHKEMDKIKDRKSDSFKLLIEKELTLKAFITAKHGQAFLMSVVLG